jgi:hypothetical protein
MLMRETLTSSTSLEDIPTIKDAPSVADFFSTLMIAHIQSEFELDGPSKVCLNFTALFILIDSLNLLSIFDSQFTVVCNRTFSGVEETARQSCCSFLQKNSAVLLKKKRKVWAISTPNSRLISEMSQFLSKHHGISQVR